MASNMRLRLVFEDRKILSHSQTAQGLNRSWFLLNPRHQTISDLTDHLLCVFDLVDSCSDGLVLSIDDFVLPPFESTLILKESDVISVKRKRFITDERRCLEVEDIAEENLVNGGKKLLANDECEKENGGYESDSEEGGPLKFDDTPKKTVSKKRKASKKLTRSNDIKKRKKSATTEEGLNTPPVDAQNEIQPQQNGRFRQHTLLLKKNAVEDGEPSDTSAELNSSGNSDIDEGMKNVTISLPSGKRSCQVKENCKKNVVSTESDPADGSNKSVSRSTVRKKLRRKKMREEMKAKKLELKQPQSDKIDNSKLCADHQQTEECNNEGSEIVPLVVRPGHIRFEPFDKADADHTVQQHEISVEKFQWNGIASKRKGQNRGREKTVSCKRSKQKNQNQESPNMLVNKEKTTIKVPIDFNTLQTCGTLPQEGDILAYRLIEVLSSCTPEISPFRVGKVSKYDPKSEKVTLIQVPEYPIVIENDGGEESAPKLDMSHYNEDGSLEIDYASLVDVRIVELGKSNSTKLTTPMTRKATWGVQIASSSRSRPISRKQQKGKQPKFSMQGNRKEISWDDMCAEVEAKKAQLVKKDNWTRTGTTSEAWW